MRIIGKERLQDFTKRHADAKTALDAWNREVKAANWRSSTEVKRRFRSASFLRDNRVVFNVKGNTYRLVVRMYYKRSKVVVRFIGTHAEYDKINAETI